MRFRPFLAAVSALLLTAAAPDSFSIEELEALEEERRNAVRQLEALEEAEVSAETDVNKLNEALIAAAMESRRREEQATSAERSLIDLEIRRRTANERLYADEAALEDLLAALMSASRSRPPALVVAPEKANTSVRSAILMGGAAPELATRAETLAEEIAGLNRLERNIRREKARLDAAEATLELKKVEIEQLAAAKRVQYEDVSIDAARLRARATQLASEADDLRGLLEALAAEAPSSPGRKPARPQPVSASPNAGTPQPLGPQPATPNLSGLTPLGARQIGAMVRPVAGSVSEAYGKRRQTGGRSEGLTIITRQDAQVLSPVDGVIEFADEFRSYGHMLILRTSDDYRVIMTGLGTTYGTRGQVVTAGEPVGRMSSRVNPPPELYLELRKNDRSENPAGWMER